MKNISIISYIILLYILAIIIFYENMLCIINETRSTIIETACSLILEKVDDNMFIQTYYTLICKIYDEDYIFVRWSYHIVSNENFIRNFIETITWLPIGNTFEDILEQTPKMLFNKYLTHLHILEKEFVLDMVNKAQNIVEIKQHIEKHLLNNLLNHLELNNDTINNSILITFIKDFMENVDWICYINTVDYNLGGYEILTNILIQQFQYYNDPYSKILQDISTLITILGFSLILYHVIIPNIILTLLYPNKVMSLSQTVLNHYGVNQHPAMTPQLFQECCELFAKKIKECSDPLFLLNIRSEHLINYIDRTHLINYIDTTHFSVYEPFFHIIYIINFCILASFFMCLLIIKLEKNDTI